MRRHSGWARTLRLLGGDPRCRAAQTYEPGPPGTDPEGKRSGGKKGENISFECLSQPTSKTSSASKQRHFLSSPPSTLSGSPALKKGEIRASACSLSQPDHEGSIHQHRQYSIEGVQLFPTLFSLFLRCQSSTLAGHTLHDTSYHTDDATKSSLPRTRRHHQHAR